MTAIGAEETAAGDLRWSVLCREAGCISGVVDDDSRGLAPASTTIRPYFREKRESAAGVLSTRPRISARGGDEQQTSMSVTIDLPPEIEASLAAPAAAQEL